jgi:hypothetical protein
VFKVPEVKIAEAKDWIRIDGAEKIYTNMKRFLEGIGMEKVDENYYHQDLASNYFKAKINSSKKLDSLTTLKFDITIFTRDTPKQGEKGIIATIDLNIVAKLSFSFPTEDYSPKILARILTKFWWYSFYIRQWHMWEELAEEKLKNLIDDIRRAFNLPRAIGRTKRFYYKPI